MTPNTDRAATIARVILDHGDATAYSEEAFVDFLTDLLHHGHLDFGQEFPNMVQRSLGHFFAELADEEHLAPDSIYVNTLVRQIGDDLGALVQHASDFKQATAHTRRMHEESL